MKEEEEPFFIGRLLKSGFNNSCDSSGRIMPISKKNKFHWAEFSIVFVLENACSDYSWTLYCQRVFCPHLNDFSAVSCPQFPAAVTIQHAYTHSTRTYAHNSLCKCVDLHMDLQSNLFAPCFASAQSNQSLSHCCCLSRRSGFRPFREPRVGVQAVEAHTSGKVLRHTARQTVHSSSQLQGWRATPNIRRWETKQHKEKHCCLIRTRRESRGLQVQLSAQRKDALTYMIYRIYMIYTSMSLQQLSYFLLLRCFIVAETQMKANLHQVRLSCCSCLQLSLGSWSCSPAGRLLEGKRKCFKTPFK